MGEIVENSVEGIILDISSRLEELQSLAQEIESYNLEDSASIGSALAQAEKLRSGLLDVKKVIQDEALGTSAKTKLKGIGDGLDCLVGFCDYLFSYLKASTIPMVWAEKIEAKKGMDTRASIGEAQEAFEQSLRIMEATTVPDIKELMAELAGQNWTGA